MTAATAVDVDWPTIAHHLLPHVGTVVLAVLIVVVGAWSLRGKE